MRIYKGSLYVLEAKIKGVFWLYRLGMWYIITMKSMSLNTRLAIGIVALLCIVALVVVIRGRPYNSLPVDQNGGSVTIFTLHADSQVVADNLSLHDTFSNKESFTFYKLTPTAHQFAVTKNNYWPWAKTITVELQSSTTLNSFSILMKPTRDDISDKSDLYKSYKKEMNSHQLPIPTSILRSFDGSMAVWADQNIIFAEWLGESSKIPYYFCKEKICSSRIVVLSSLYNIRSLEFLPGYNDVVVFANDTSINAIELNRDDIQNFQPIYQADMPKFVLDGDNGMIVESKDSMFHLSF